MSRTTSEATPAPGSARTPAPARRGAVAASIRRVRSLARAEVRLLLRNRTAMFTAFALPIATVLMLSSMGIGENSDVPVASMTVTAMVGFVLLFVVYYNLVTAYVARREELVLKRLRVGEATDAEVLAGTALPSLAVATVQVVIVAAAVAVVLGMDAPVNVALVLLGFAAGALVFVLLAGVSTAFTRNVEMAQLSTMPVLLVCMVLSGMVAPLHTLPEPVEAVARFLPLTPVIDLTTLGLAGVTPDGSTVDFAGSFGAAVLPTAIALAWIGVGVWAQRRWFRWEPRA